MIYAIVFLILLAIELGYFFLANRFNIIDKPNMRSSHTHITLRGGGIIFPLSMWGFALFFGFEYIWFLTGLTLICAVSFADDLRAVPSKIRLIVQFISIFLMLYQLGIVSLEDWWMVILGLIFCAGVINVYNFMDGINGITGGYSLAILLPLMAINYYTPFIEMSFLFITTIGILVFCLFNFRKRAKCFAGDVGSVGIAFIILFAIGKLIIQTGDLYYVSLLAIYGVDSVLTILHRIKLKEKITEPHRKHAYQLMANELKMPHVYVSIMYMVTQLLVSAGLIWLPINKWLYIAIVLILFSLIYILFKKKYYHLHEEYLKSKNA